MQLLLGRSSLWGQSRIRKDTVWWPLNSSSSSAHSEAPHSLVVSCAQRPGAGTSCSAVSRACPGCSAKQGLPMQRAETELRKCPGAAEREEKQPKCLLLPSLWAELCTHTALPRVHSHSSSTEMLPAPLVGHGTKTPAAGPDEGEGCDSLPFLFPCAIPGCPLATTQHLELAQGQAELWVWGTARPAERSSRE